MMHKYQVKTVEQALAYLTDCTLATVIDMAMKKRRVKYEFERQISIAQTAFNWMNLMNIDYSHTRAEDVKNSGGNVANWAKQYVSGPSYQEPKGKQ
jgi:hypothetical protein